MAELNTSSSNPPRAFLAAVVVFALVGVIGLIAGAKLLGSRRSPPLEVFFPVPAFQFTDQRGAPFGSEQLKGRVWVANFVFTRCPTICPLFTRRMGEVQKRSASEGTVLQLVSFSVDPAFDTPKVLADYALTHHADPLRWTFLTGERDKLRALIVEGLKVHMGDITDDLMAAGHGGSFVLVDARMQVRGFYNSEEPDAVERIVQDAQKLVKEARFP